MFKIQYCFGWNIYSTLSVFYTYLGCDACISRHSLLISHINNDIPLFHQCGHADKYKVTILADFNVSPSWLVDYLLAIKFLVVFKVVRFVQLIALGPIKGVHTCLKFFIPGCIQNFLGIWCKIQVLLIIQCKIQVLFWSWILPWILYSKILGFLTKRAVWTPLLTTHSCKVY